MFKPHNLVLRPIEQSITEGGNTMITLNAAKAFCFAALSYLKEDMVEAILGLHDGLECNFESREDGALKFGYVIDKAKNQLFFVGRGTGGDTKAANRVSWLKYDFNALTGEDGEHNGFQNAGNQFFEWLKAEGVLSDPFSIVTGSHSQGSGYMQRMLLLMSRHYSTRRVDAHLFACPPYFKKGHELELSAFIQSPHSPMTITRYVQPGDPIDMELLRGSVLGGVDIGTEYVLPDLIKQGIGIAEAINHSCTLQCAGLTIEHNLNRFETTEDVPDEKEIARVLAYTFERCAN